MADLTLLSCKASATLLRGSTNEFSHCFSALRNGVLGKFTRQNKTDRSLYFAAGKSISLASLLKSNGLCDETFKDIVDKGIHNGHGFLGYGRIGMHLLEDLVNVNSKRFLALGFLLFLLNHNLLNRRSHIRVCISSTNQKLL